MTDNIEIQVKKRPWFEWLLWGIWALALFFAFQNALASGQELEPRAAVIFWVIFAVLLIGGIVVWFMRRGK